MKTIPIKITNYVLLHWRAHIRKMLLHSLSPSLDKQAGSFRYFTFFLAGFYSTKHVVNNTENTHMDSYYVTLVFHHPVYHPK